MTSWMEFAQQAPELAAFGKARFESGVAYLGTLRADGGPRVHPVTPSLAKSCFYSWNRLHLKAKTYNVTLVTHYTVQWKIPAVAEVSFTSEGMRY